MAESFETDAEPEMVRYVRSPVILSYATFVLIGISAGVSGVLLPAQMQDYGVGRAAIGVIFFTFSAGYVLSSLNAGPLINRFGVRGAMAAGGGTFTVAGLYLATRPPFAVFVLAQLVAGYGTGMLESALNAYLASLPGATPLLNRLHAFFGVGALVGPALAAWIVGFAPWTMVWLIMGLACIPLNVASLVAFPGRQTAEPAVDVTQQATHADGGLLRAALRDRGVLLGAAMLAIYVGIEMSVGNWAFSYLVQARALPESLAGYSVSGYWLGLTLGRFLIAPVAARVGAGTARMMYACLIGVAAAATLAWLSPAAALTSASLLLLGFFLGPIFPTTMAIVPQLTRPRLVPTAIGVMNAASVIGGAGLPWLAGATTQNTGMWALWAIAVTLAALQFAVWRPITAHVRQDQ
jgi:fucose permease